MIKLNNKFQNFTIIGVGILFFFGYLFSRYFQYYQIKFLKILFSPLIFLPLIAAYILFFTFRHYKEEWRKVLGLSKKNITKKINKRAFGVGLLISVVMNTLIVTVIVLFNLPVSNLYGEISLSVLIVAATIITPFAEEIMFRGFIQGSLTRKHVLAGKKKQIRNITIIVAFLFTIAHFHYIIHSKSTILWLLLLIGIFISGLYLGHLRNKYQSIIPTIFAHFGFNMAMAVMPLITMLMMPFLSDAFISEYRNKMNQVRYTNDSVYNFDPNDCEEMRNAKHKFLAFNNPPHPEFKEYINKPSGPTSSLAAFVYVKYDIDTCGFVHNVRLDSTRLTENVVETYNSDTIEKVALRVVESFPQHKPFIQDGKKTKKTQTTIISISY